MTRSTPWTGAALAIAVVSMAGLFAAPVATTQDVPPQESPPQELLSDGSGTPRPARPDVVVVVATGLDRAAIASVDTPVLDALFERGRVFDGYRVDPASVPTCFALQFGAHAGREGLGGELASAAEAAAHVPGWRASVAELVRLADYRTFALGLWDLDHPDAVTSIEGPRLRGYDHWNAGLVTVRGATTDLEGARWWRIDDGARAQSSIDASVTIANAFVRTWAEPGDRPRFAFLAFPAPAHPVGAAPSQRLATGAPLGRDDTELRAAAVATFDRELARVVAALDLDRTVLLVTSTSASASASELHERIAVPFVALGAGVVPGRSARPTHPVDVPATVLDLAGVVPRRGARGEGIGFEDGVSFARDLAGNATERDPILCLAFEPNGGERADRSERWCVVDDDGSVLAVDGDAERLFGPYAGTGTESATVERLRAVRATIPD